MKKIIGAVVILAIFGALGLGVLRSQETEEVLSISDIQKAEGVPVYAETATARDVLITREYFGTVQAAEQAVVTSRLMERVLDIRVEEGDRVRPGETLAVFDTSASQAAVAQARLAFLNAKKDHARMANLHEAGAISAQQLDQVTLALEVARENYQTARRSVFLEAPIAGTVARVDVKEGDLANPGDPVATILADSGYEIVFDITQEDRASLASGQPVTVSLNGGDPLTGAITRISLAAEAMTRTFEVHASLPNVPGIYPGILAEVQVVVQRADQVLSVPGDALLDRDGEQVLFVIDGGTAVQRSVEIGLGGEDFVEIVHGLRPGETVATYGHAALEDGVKVKVIARNTVSGS